MANPVNNYALNYSTARDDSEDPRDTISGNLHPSLASQDPSVMAFANSGNYGFNPMLAQEDGDLSLQSFNRASAGPDLEGRMSNVMLAYDSVPNPVSMPLNLDASGAFAYDLPTSYPATTMGLAPSMDNRTLQQNFPTFAQSLPQTNQFLQQQPPPASNPKSNGNFEDSDYSRASDTAQQQTQTRPSRPIQERQRVPQYNQPTPYGVPPPVAIQPKQPALNRGDRHSTGLATPDAASNEHTGIYSSSGFDVLGVLSRVSQRPNPKINIGAVDLSCAFALCDITRDDHPIVYVSDAFERLTGYTRDEIVDRNCRFLQAPDGKIDAGAKRTFVDGQTVHRLRSTIEDRTEIQASLINYRKGGQPFMNLITMIPIRWDSDDFRFYVGFQVDLVEKPDAVTRRNPDGSYSINYQRDQLPQYIVPPPDVYRLRPDLMTQFGHDQVTAILNAVGVPGSGVSQNYLDRILVENTDDVIHVLSFNGEFLYLSPSCARILEYDPVELVGKTLSTICHPSDIGPVIRDFRASTTPAPISVVYRIRQKYRGYMWFESHGAWHIDPQQGRKYLVMTGRPRPVYSLDQIALLGSSAALAENDVWAKVSLSGVILFMTSKSKPVLGRPPDDFIGKGLHELMEPEGGPSAISDALEAAANGSTYGTEENSSISAPEPPSFRHQMRHKKGHSLSAQTTIYSGDTHKARPTFLVIQIRFARAFPPSAAATEAAADEDITNVPGTSKTTTLSFKDTNPPRQYGALGQRIPDLSSIIGLNGLPSGNRSLSPSDAPATLFTELNPTRGSSWQIELRELEKQNRTLSDELQRLINRRKKRKRKQSALSLEKACVMCKTKNTPEWRRGPSGNRDLCNSCGLRWAKQVRSQSQSQSVTIPTTTAA
ncbi:White collar 1 protein [Penicillium hetheringtonii]|uniref:White collar 1 protein n=1 Tax=Penicillium hetheringtonii TaxID=911720 RepID=A0AAD6GNR0_9EURO|nr:White collar 1 protein [Penicillium hetheringtonii]